MTNKLSVLALFGSNHTPDPASIMSFVFCEGQMVSLCTFISPGCPRCFAYLPIVTRDRLPQKNRVQDAVSIPTCHSLLLRYSNCSVRNVSASVYDKPFASE